VSSSFSRVSIQKTTLSFNITTSKLYKTSLALLKPTQIFSFIITFLKATLKASRKAFFLIFLVLYYAKLLILLLYACFKGKKQPILSSYSR
jgi:hypothetical protein